MSNSNDGSTLNSQLDAATSAFNGKGGLTVREAAARLHPEGRPGQKERLAIAKAAMIAGNRDPDAVAYRKARAADPTYQPVGSFTREQAESMGLCAPASEFDDVEGRMCEDDPDAAAFIAKAIADGATPEQFETPVLERRVAPSEAVREAWEKDARALKPYTSAFTPEGFAMEATPTQLNVIADREACEGVKAASGSSALMSLLSHDEQ